MRPPEISTDEVIQAAEEMQKLLDASKSKSIDIETTRDMLRKTFGLPVVYTETDTGSERIHPKVLKQFKHQVEKYAVHDRRDKSWRYRQKWDTPDKWSAE